MDLNFERDRMEVLISAYIDYFDDGFPSHAVPGLGEKELRKLIEKCLREGKPVTYYYPYVKGARH